MSDLLREMRRSERAEGDSIRSLLAELDAKCRRQGRSLSPTVRGMAKLILDLCDIGAGKKFYGMSGQGNLRLYTRKREPREIKRRREDSPLCGAMTRKGTPCRALPVEGRGRCRNHGGASTGPKTAEGRARIADSNRQRARLRKIYGGSVLRQRDPTLPEDTKLIPRWDSLPRGEPM